MNGMSFARKRLWFVDRRGAYTVAGVARFTGVLDLEVLAACVADVVAGRAPLRSAWVRMPLTDLSGLSRARAEEQAEVVGLQQAQRPFDLDTGPTLRVGLVRLSATEHELIITVHQVDGDATAVNAMLDGVAERYADPAGRRRAG